MILDSKDTRKDHVNVFERKRKPLLLENHASKSTDVTKLEYTSTVSSRTPHTESCFKKINSEITITVSDATKLIKQQRLEENHQLIKVDANSKNSDMSVDTMDIIPQLDGIDDLSESSDQIEETEPSKDVFGINCEYQEIVQLMNFFRSFNVSWLSSKDHKLCWLDEECFFCNLRSMFLRLRQERIKGPFLLKLNEFVCSISKYEEILEYSFMDNLLQIEKKY